MIDLFCGLGGWAEGFLAEGYYCVGFDIERHDYGQGGYPGQLVLQDTLTLDGAQFKNATCIVASPPCQEFSHMAMPWSRGKQIAAALREELPFPEPYMGSRTLGELRALFDACFRIQREASEAAGHPIPLVVENVKGAQPWVGSARANFGSYYLWGDIGRVGNALIAGPPAFGNILRAGRSQKFNPDGTEHPQGSWFKIANSQHRGANSVKNNGGSWFAIANNTSSGHRQNPDGRKVPGIDFNGYGKPGYKAKGFNVTAAQRHREGVKVESAQGRRTDPGKGALFTTRDCGIEGVKGMSGLRGLSGLSHPNGGSSDLGGSNDPRRFSSRSDSRKAASAQIAKIPFALSSYIARAFKPG